MMKRLLEWGSFIAIIYGGILTAQGKVIVSQNPPFIKINDASPTPMPIVQTRITPTIKPFLAPASDITASLSAELGKMSKSITCEEAYKIVRSYCGEGN